MGNKTKADPDQLAKWRAENCFCCWHCRRVEGMSSCCVCMAYATKTEPPDLVLHPYAGNCASFYARKKQMGLWGGELDDSDFNRAGMRKMMEGDRICSPNGPRPGKASDAPSRNSSYDTYLPSQGRDTDKEQRYRDYDLRKERRAEEFAKKAEEEKPKPKKSHHKKKPEQPKPEPVKAAVENAETAKE